MLSGEEVVLRLAGYLLQIKEGERLHSVREFAKAHNTSVGSVSNALASIEGSGAVKIDRRGHLGSFIETRSIGQLWAIAEREPMVVAFPLIAHPCLEGFATGLKKQLREAGMDVYLIFIRGSRTRMKALRENKCHIAVMSTFAATQLCSDEEELLLGFPAESYVTRHEVFYRPDQPAAGKPLRVSDDRDSIDIHGLTELEFDGADVEFKPVTFMQLPRLLKNNLVDAGIWSIDDMRPQLMDGAILHRPLSDRVIEIVDDSDTCAALVGRSNYGSVRAVIEATMDVATILDVQQKVVNGELVPEY